MVSLVLGADHHSNAAIVKRAGFGIALRPEDCTPEVARELAERLIADHAFRDAAQQQQAAIASMPTPDAVAAELTDRFDS